MTTTRKSLPPELRVRLYGWLATVFLVCATCAAILVPTERWEKLGRFLTDPTTAGALTALGGAVVALYMRARHSPAPVLLLALGLSWGLVGCTPSQWSDAMHVIKPAGKFACDVARVLCVKGDDVACGAILAACEGFDAVIPLLGETSGGEEEGTGIGAVDDDEQP